MPGILTGPVVTGALFAETGIKPVLALGGMLGVVFGIARGFRLGGAAVFTHWGIRLILARQKERPGQHLGFGQEQEQHPVITRGRTDLIRRSFFTQASESSLSFCHA